MEVLLKSALGKFMRMDEFTGNLQKTFTHAIQWDKKPTWLLTFLQQFSNKSVSAVWVTTSFKIWHRTKFIAEFLLAKAIEPQDIEHRLIGFSSTISARTNKFFFIIPTTLISPPGVVYKIRNTWQHSPYTNIKNLFCGRALEKHGNQLDFDDPFIKL